MIESMLTVVRLIVSGEPGDTITSKKMLGDEVRMSVVVWMPPNLTRMPIEFHLLPDEIGKVTFDCNKPRV